MGVIVAAENSELSRSLKSPVEHSAIDNVQAVGGVIDDFRDLESSLH